MRALTKAKTILFVAFLATALSYGCGSDDGPGGGGSTISPGNNSNDSNNGTTTDGGGTDATDAGDVATDATDAAEDVELDSADDADTAVDAGEDASDTGEDDASGCTEGDCPTGQICVDGACTTETADLKCQAAEDLGEIQRGTPVTVTGTLRGASDQVATACGPAQGAEAMYRFTVAETSDIQFNATWQGQYDGVVEFRTDSCVTPGSASDPCFDHESRSFLAEAGHTYYMVVELSSGRPHDFTIELQATEAGCVAGSVTCANDVLSRCNFDGSSSDYECADTCTGAQTSCRGDTCEEPIAVTAPGTYTGNNAAYQSNYDFGAIAGCEIAGASVNTPGPEVAFVLPGLTQGQEVSIDALSGDQNNNAIFITSNCGRPDELNCLAGDYINESLTWTVPSDGTYYVFIDKASGAGSDFQYGIDIQ